jgi:hypothetical protein
VWNSRSFISVIISGDSYDDFCTLLNTAVCFLHE